MKKYFTVFSVIMCLVVFSCSTGDKSVETGPTGVAFVEKSLDDVIALAKEENKLILIDFFSPTCESSVALGKFVWQDNEVGEFVNKTYIPLRVQTQDPDSGYPQYRKDFSTRGTPTVIFLDADGKEIDRFFGYGGEEEDRDETFQKVKDYAAGINTLPALLANLGKNPNNVGLNFKLAEKYQDRLEMDKTIPYFEKVLELDPDNEKGHKVESTYQVALFQAQTEQNVEPLKAFIATNPEEKYLVNAYANLAYTYLRKKDTENTVAIYEEALQKLPDNAQLMFYYSSTIFREKIEDLYERGLELNEKVKTLDPEMEVSTIYNLVTYYTNLEDQEKIIETFENAIGKFPDSAGLKSSYASSINSMEIESKYDMGIKIMENALAVDPNAVFMNYALGLLYQKKGELEKAIAALKKVVEQYPTQKVYMDALAKMQKELEELK